jgi:hypothetical protein
VSVVTRLIHKVGTAIRVNESSERRRLIPQIVIVGLRVPLKCRHVGAVACEPCVTRARIVGIIRCLRQTNPRLKGRLRRTDLTPVSFPLLVLPPVGLPARPPRPHQILLVRGVVVGGPTRTTHPSLTRTLHTTHITHRLPAIA